MKVAVEGCCHGELDEIYATLKGIEQKEGSKIDLLICCGDFQACRNLTDLDSLSVPKKYRSMQNFYKYYTGEMVAPILTIFIGGNHEAACHQYELPDGGWVAPNIYYLGYSGVINVSGLRIGGLSGIYKAYSYQKGYYEQPPFTEDMFRTMYHTREFEVFKLLQLAQPLDVMISHDWPQGVAEFGDYERLFRVKPFLRAERQTFGSPANRHLLSTLRPAYWFSGHMHVHFPATVPHPSPPQVPEDQHQTQHQAQNVPIPVTHFLALDKVQPRRQFLQVLDIPSPGPGPGPSLSYDPEWLTILLRTRPLRPTSPFPTPMPSPKDPGQRRYDYHVSGPALASIQQHAAQAGLDLTIPYNFERTAVAFSPQQPHLPPPPNQPQPQVHAFEQLLATWQSLPGVLDENHQNQQSTQASPQQTYPANPEEIDLDL